MDKPICKLHPADSTTLLIYIDSVSAANPESGEYVAVYEQTAMGRTVFIKLNSRHNVTADRCKKLSVALALAAEAAASSEPMETFVSK